MNLLQRLLDGGRDSSEDDLENAEIEGSGVENYITLFGSNDDEEEEGDEYEIPLWIVMIFIFCLAVMLAWSVFYFSYTHERVVENQRFSRRSCSSKKGLENTPIDQLERDGLSIKRGQDSNDAAPGPHVKGFSDAEFQSDGSMATRSSASSGNSTDGVESIRSSGRKSLVQLLKEPRCVLCSRCYETGEDIIHSDNPKCHHEYHLNCLDNYWKENNKNDGNCPVCKEHFILQLTA